MRRGLGLWASIGASFVALLLLAFVARSCAQGGSEVAGPASVDVSFEPPVITAAPALVASPSPLVSPSAAPAAAPAGSSGSGAGSGSRRSGSGSGSGSDSGSGSSQPAGRVVCPSGRVTAEQTDFNADEHSGSEVDPDTGERQFDVVVSGTVTNDTSRPARDIQVNVSVFASDGRANTQTAVISQYIGTGSTASWTTHHRVRSKDQPGRHDTQVTVGGWSWGAGFEQCPT